MTELLTSGLPQAALAERALIGAVLTQAHQYPLVRDAVAPGDFTISKHQTIWRRIGDLHEAGTPVDRVSIATLLHQHGELEAIDGVTYLIDLEDKAVPNANVESYAAVIAETATRRRLIVAAQQIAEIAASPDPLQSVLDKSKAMLSDLAPSTAGEFATPGDVVAAAGGLDEYLSRFRSRGMAWPWPGLTAATSGLFPGELCIVAAGTGKGKTDFAINTTLHCVTQGHGVAVFSLEMSRDQVVNRLAALSGGFHRSLVRHEPMVWQRAAMQAGFSGVADLPVFIRDSSACTVASIEAGVRRLKAKHDIRLVVVDYLQLVTGRGQTRAEQVGSVARGLKVMASALNVTVLAPCQFSRDHQKAGARPQLHDLRESGDIEQAANVVLFLYGETRYDKTPAERLPVELIVAKQRDGANNFTIPMMFRGDTGKFEEAEA